VNCNFSNGILKERAKVLKIWYSNKIKNIYYKLLVKAQILYAKNRIFQNENTCKVAKYAPQMQLHRIFLKKYKKLFGGIELRLTFAPALIERGCEWG